MKKESIDNNMKTPEEIIENYSTYSSVKESGDFYKESDVLDAIRVYHSQYSKKVEVNEIIKYLREEFYNLSDNERVFLRSVILDFQGHFDI